MIGLLHPGAGVCATQRKDESATGKDSLKFDIPKIKSEALSNAKSGARMTAKPCVMVNWVGACRYLARFRRPQFADIASASEIRGRTKNYGSKAISFERRWMKAGFGIERLGPRIGTCNR